MKKRDNLMEVQNKAEVYNLEVLKKDGGFFRKGIKNFKYKLNKFLKQNCSK